MKNHTPIETDQVTVDVGALISMYSLADEVRDYVLRTLTELSTLPPEQWPADKVHRHRRGLPLYILSAPDDLRVFFRRTDDGKIAIADVVNQTTLDLYFSGNSAQGAS